MDSRNGGYSSSQQDGGFTSSAQNTNHGYTSSSTSHIYPVPPAYQSTTYVTQSSSGFYHRPQPQPTYNNGYYSEVENHIPCCCTIL